MLNARKLPTDFGQVIQSSFQPEISSNSTDPFANFEEEIQNPGLGASIENANMEARLMRLEINQQ